MQNTRLLGLFFSIPLLLIVVSTFFFSNALTAILDIIFYIGLVFLVIGSVFLLVQEGFFTSFIRNSKRFFAAISKQEQVIRDAEGRSDEPTFYAQRFPFIKTLFAVGAFYFALSTAASLLHLYFGR